MIGAVSLGFDRKIRDVEEMLSSALCSFVPGQGLLENIVVVVPEIVGVAFKAVKSHAKRVLG